MTVPTASNGRAGADAELVAIVGMGCRWPGGVNSPQQMWSFLRGQRSGFCPFDSASFPRCFSAAGFYHPNPKRQGTTATEGAFLVDSDPRLFDPTFYGITGREAETLDPSQRKLLEVVYEAFENAGETWASVAGSNTGVFVGNFALDHWIIQARDWEYPKPYSTTGASPSMLANRISHIFDLRGPSVTVDTACSSSMYAIHLAVNAIRNGDCDSAIVAASNWISDPSLQIALDKLGALSPTSRCHTFDASADGYARGEGFAALYLKRLPAAVASKSPIRAVIRGTAVNANGRTGGITRPCADGQESVIRKAYANAGLPFSDTAYFECHGTGTPAGDPIEVAAIARVFGASEGNQGVDSPEPLFIGSVKTNMGHAEGASALAAIMKVVLSLEAGEIPPNFGVETLNPNIDFAKAGVEVVRQVTAWPTNKLRRASINSFGFGGANGHAIVESYDAQSSSIPKLNGHAVNGNAKANGDTSNEHIDNHSIVNGNDGTRSRKRSTHCPITEPRGMTKAIGATTRQLVLLPFSTHNETSLHLNIKALSRDISRHQLADVAYTLSAKRSELSYRAALIINSDDPVSGLLDEDREQGTRISHIHKPQQQPANIAFVFTGQGAQWHGMGTQLFEYRIFRTAIEHLDNILTSLPTPLSAWSITDVLKCNCDPDLIQTPVVSQTICTAIQIGLVDLLASWGVRPSAVAGHSSGEIAASYASGRSTAADAIVAAYMRGRAVTSNNRDGAMLAVGLGLDQLQESGYLDDYDSKDGQIQVAAINSPGSVTLSGDRSAVEALAARLAIDGIFHRVLKTGGMAYHSHHMLALGQEYEESLNQGFSHLRKFQLVDEQQQQQRYPQVPWFSSVTPGKDSPSAMSNSASYWRANLESPVRFSDAISNLVLRVENDSASCSDASKVLIEIGPHAALKGPVEQILKSADKTEILYAGSTLKRGEDARQSLLQLCGALYCLNAKINLVAVNAVDGDEKGLHRDTLVHGRTAVDLPPYQHAYGPISYYECRSSKEYRLRKVPRHVLLGSKVPGVAKSRPQWRNVLRIKDLPWLGDHRLLPDAVFPAAGYIAMAIEAALRIHEETPEPGLKPTGYTLRNVSIKTALRLPDEDPGTEVIFSMELINTAPTAVSSWASFSICSAVPSHVDSSDCKWTEHCTGMIKVELGVSHDQIGKIDTMRMDARAVDARSWYNTFTTIGLGYGPTFQTITGIRVDPDMKLASATVALNTTAGVSEEDKSEYAIHPAALDGTFQLGLIACYGGRAETAATAFVPVHFSRLYVKHGAQEGCRDTSTAVALGELRGLRGAYVNKLQMLNADGDVVLNVEKLRCISLPSETHPSRRHASSAFRSPFSRMVWKPDFRTLNSQACRALYPPPEANIERLGSITKLNRLASAILVDAYEKFVRGATEAELVPTPSGDIGHFFNWIKRNVEVPKAPGIDDLKSTSSQERRDIIDRLYEETHDIPEARIAYRLHEHMADILSERQTGVDIMVHNSDGTNLLSALYQRGLFMTSAYPQLTKVLEGLSHANPHLRILEVGAGTGGATRVAMKALTGPNGNKRYREYVFTDISPGFLAAAQSSMTEFRDISYSVLDIEADPEAQGYQPVYDIVLASQTLHATASISRTLEKCRKLLKPRGKLVLVENTREDSMIVGLILGTLTGYWHGIPDGRVNSPFMNLETWDRALKDTGFSGAELVLDDYPRPNNTTTTLVSTLVKKESILQNGETGNILGDTEVHLLCGHGLHPPLLDTISQELRRRNINPKTTPINQACNTIGAGAHVVVFLNTEEDFLLDTQARYLAVFQYLARTAATLVYLTSCGYSKGRNPEGALIPGLMRTIGTENPAGRFFSIDISAEKVDISTYDSRDLAYCIVEKVLPSTRESNEDEDEDEGRSHQRNDCEYIWQDGCLWVSRAVPEDTLQPYAEINSKSNEQEVEKMSLQPLITGKPVRAAFSTPGILSSLYFRPYTELLAPIPPDHIDVQVVGVGINWKDLAVSSGRFDADNLSSEYAGIVTAVGTDAADTFCVGDRVYGMGRGHFGNYTRVPAAFAQKLNAQDDLVEAATMPLVYMTAVYAFDHVARLRRGHRVLIQSATGGLGLAAIQLARAKGAEVFAMAGSSEKVAFLTREMKIPESNVIEVCSRNNECDLDKRLARMTPGGRGFDVILGTGSGDILHASLQALAPLGHYVDVGRTDVQDSKAFMMDAFDKGASFSSFDLSHVLRVDPGLGSELMQDVHNYYRSGLIGPINPFTATDVSQLDQTLLKFSKGTHVGKLVVTFQDPQTLVRMLPAPAQPRVQFDPVASYIIVGGLGGLGRSIMRWMCERGARHLVVLSRRGVEANSSAAQNLVKTLGERGVQIQTLVCDVSNQTQVTRIIDSLSSDSSSAPLRGIVHAAVSYLDISFDKLDAPRWRDSLAAKVQGTRNLHEATLSIQAPLEFFVMTTSLESIYALATQSAYTAANAFQDAFARHRRQLGLPATSISFGFVKGIGELGQDSITVDMFVRNKAVTLTEGEFLARLEPAFLGADTGNGGHTDGSLWFGHADDPLSASTILTCLDPGAMVTKEQNDEAETRNTGLARPPSGAVPRWFGDARVSHIMRAFEDARRDERTKSSSTIAQQEGDNNNNSNNKSSTGRIRREFDAAIASSGASGERSKTTAFVISAISTSVAELLFVDASNVNAARAVADHGVDSLIAAELRNWFHQALGVNISMQDLLDSKISIAALAGGIVDAALAEEGV